MNLPNREWFDINKTDMQVVRHKQTIRLAARRKQTAKHQFQINKPVNRPLDVNKPLNINFGSTLKHFTAALGTPPKLKYFTTHKFTLRYRVLITASVTLNRGFHEAPNTYRWRTRIQRGILTFM